MTESKKYFRYYTYIEPVIKTPIIKTYGSAILTFTSLTIFIFFAIKPTVETILVLQKQLEDSKTVLAQVQKKSEDLTLAEKNFNSLDHQVSVSIQTAIPTKPDLKNFIQTLELTATRNEATISAFQISPIVIHDKPPQSTSTTLQDIKFIFNVEGPYQNIKRVLQELNQSSRILSIDSVVFKKTQSSGNVIISVTGKGHYLE